MNYGIVLNLKHEFVDFIPEKPEQGTLYISIRYKTGTHVCCCGCGNIVVTPISPTDWKLTFDGKTVSLHPSIGNWGFPCQSHYWIRQNRVEWAPKWPRDQIDLGRLRYDVAKEEYFTGADVALNASAKEDFGTINHVPPKRGFWQALKKWFS